MKSDAESQSEFQKCDTDSQFHTRNWGQERGSGAMGTVGQWGRP
jgi:hypothetical protein